MIWFALAPLVSAAAIVAAMNIVHALKTVPNQKNILSPTPLINEHPDWRKKFYGEVLAISS
jgi:hypothetical protein